MLATLIYLAKHIFDCTNFYQLCLGGNQIVILQIMKYMCLCPLSSSSHYWFRKHSDQHKVRNSPTLLLSVPL